jgi:hypothetical protein
VAAVPTADSRGQAIPGMTGLLACRRTVAQRQAATVGRLQALCNNQQPETRCWAHSFARIAVARTGCCCRQAVAPCAAGRRRAPAPRWRLFACLRLKQAVAAAPWHVLPPGSCAAEATGPGPMRLGSAAGMFPRAADEPPRSPQLRGDRSLTGCDRCHGATTRCPYHRSCRAAPHTRLREVSYGWCAEEGPHRYVYAQLLSAMADRTAWK